MTGKLTIYKSVNGGKLEQINVFNFGTNEKAQAEREERQAEEKTRQEVANVAGKEENFIYKEKLTARAFYFLVEQEEQKGLTCYRVETLKDGFKYCFYKATILKI